MDEPANVAAGGQRLGAVDGALRVGPLSLRRAPRAKCRTSLRAKFGALGVEAADDQIGARQVGNICCSSVIHQNSW